MMNFNKYIIGAGALLLSICAQTVSAAEMFTEWKSFPSMEWRHHNNKQKVAQLCPSERYVYALVHGHYYSLTETSDYNYYKEAFLNLFVYDTENPELGFKPAQYFFPDVSGLNLTAIAYNKERKYLMTTYADGQIYMMYDDGRVVRISEFMDAKVPGSKRVNSIAFDYPRGEAYLATQNGYIVIDEESGTVNEWVKLWGQVNYINRMGDKLIAIAPVTTHVKTSGTEVPVKETTLVSFDLNKGTPTDIELFEPLVLTNKEELPKSMINSQTGNLLVTDGVLPLTQNTFITEGRKGDSSSTALSVISLTEQEDGTWRPITIADELGYIIANANLVFSPVVMGINTMKDGYCIRTYNFHLIKEGIDPDFTLEDPKADFLSKVYAKNYRPGWNQSEQYPTGGTYDRENFWTYRYCTDSSADGGFTHFKKNGGGSLDIVEENLLPDGPAGMFTSTIQHVPGYGMYVGGLEFSKYFQQAVEFYDLSSIYKNGTWTPVGLQITNPALYSMFKGVQGFAIDPDDPRYVYVGSYNNGLLRKNIENTEELLHISWGSSYSSKRDCDVEFITNYKTLYNPGNNGHISGPSFDAEGRLWVSSFDNVKAGKNIHEVTLLFWEKEDRLASTSKETYRPWKRLVVKGPACDNKLIFTALKHPSNKNLLALYDSNFNGSVWIIDHKGTPDDPSDDELTEIAKCVDTEGRSLNWDYIYGLKEDPEDGRLWLLSGWGLYWVNPVKAFDNPRWINRAVVERVEGVETPAVVCEASSPLAIATDVYGRKWIGTNGGGVTCLSADNKEIIATFSTKNSGLISDVIFGLGWNPENNSLLISHEKGIQEMTVLEGSVSTSSNLKVYPSSVTPGYKGLVTVNGLSDAIPVKVVDAAGEKVCDLGTPQGGKIQWDIHNHEMKRVVSGVYSFVNSATEEILVNVTVVD